MRILVLAAAVFAPLGIARAQSEPEWTAPDFSEDEALEDAELEASPDEAAIEQDAELQSVPDLPLTEPVALPGGEAKSGVTPQALALPSDGGSVEGLGESFSPMLS